MLSKLLRTSLRPYRRTLMLMAACQIVTIFGLLLLPALSANILNNGVIEGNVDYIVTVGAVMVAFAVVQLITQTIAAFLASRVAMAVGRDLRSRVFRRVMNFSEREIGEFGQASLITRSVHDVDQLQLLALSVFDVALPSVIICVGAVAMAMSLDMPMALLLLAVIVVIAVVVSLILRRMAPYYSGMEVRIDRINRILREQISGIHVIRAFVNDRRERERFGAENSELRAVSYRVGMLIALIPPVIMLATNVFSVILLMLGTYRIGSGNMAPGTLAAMLSYMGMCVMAVTLAMIMLTNVPRASVAADRVSAVLDKRTSIPAPSKAVNESITTGSVEMRSVTFMYPGASAPVLSDVDLVARPGQLLGIVGSTGSGKSTLLNLIIRLFDPTGGAVLLNGVDVRLIDPDVLPHTVALVPQTPYLFSGTIDSNLRFGRPDCTEEEVWHALEVVQARDFVSALPNGLQTPVEQGGSELSGGQRQRLAIARALIGQADIYLLDDCFSALDFVTAAAVQRALARELADKTVVMVAQRVVTVGDADSIVVLDAGRVVGVGTHAELQDNDTYREIAQSQFDGAGALR